MSFLQLHYDYSLFTQRKGCDLVIVLVYVDDLLVTMNNLELIEQARKYLQIRFKMNDLGELKNLLGIESLKSRNKIHMYQMKYALE